MSYLEIVDLSKKYEGAPNYTIKDLNLTVEQGEFVTLLGKSGCGKTTLLRLLCGFEVPDQGQIILNGKIISSKKVWIPPEKRNIGMVFQDYALFPNMTAWGNIAFPISKDKECSNKTNEMLKLIELYDFKDHYPHQLSGGQQQRVAIGRALIRQPNILLLDEPFSNLDVELKEVMYEEVLKVLRKTDTTAVFVTHDQMEALSISTRIAILHEGQIQQINTPYEVYNKPSNSFVAEFLGKVNMFHGVLENSNTISCEIGSIVSQDTIPYEKDTLVKFIIRPEDISISSSGTMKGTIASLTYLGMYYSATVLIHTRNHSKWPLLMVLPGIQDIKIDQEISFDLLIASKHHIFIE